MPLAESSLPLPSSNVESDPKSTPDAVNVNSRLNVIHSCMVPLCDPAQPCIGDEAEKMACTHEATHIFDYENANTSPASSVFSRRCRHHQSLQKSQRRCCRSKNHDHYPANGVGDHLGTFSSCKMVCKHPPRPSLISTQKMSFCEEDIDRPDALPKEMSFTLLDAAAILFSIGSFLFDVGTDIAVATVYFNNKDYIYFSLTTTFIVFPTLVTTCISLRWYILDAREEVSPPISKRQWLFRVIFLLLQLGPILRYFDSLVYGLKFRRHKNKAEQKKYFQYMVYEDTDATMLRLFECFMEAAPQLVLQLYIIATNTSPLIQQQKDDYLMVMIQMAAVMASLVSLSWSLVSYQRALRMSLPDKIIMSWPGTVVQFLWRLFVIAARVLALALFASVFRFWIGVVCGIHWIVMFSWILTMGTSFCDNKVEEVGYNAVLGIMFIFCYFNPVDNPTRYRYTIYYCFILLENSFLMSMWFFTASPTLWYRVPAMLGHFLSFFTGILFMICYYMCLHPTGDIRLWRNTDESKEEDARQTHARLGGYKRHIQNGLWTTQGRVLHPRPTVPEALPYSLSDARLSRKTGSHRKSQSADELATPCPKATCV